MLCDGRLNDPLKRVISNECNQYLHFLYEFATTAKEMTAKQGFRVQPFARDTKLAFSCKGLLNLLKHLLNVGHEYVTLGESTTV